MHLPDSLELVHWGASAIAFCTVLLRIIPRAGDCDNCIPGKFYAVFYGIVSNVANLRGQQARATDNGKGAPPEKP